MMVSGERNGYKRCERIVVVQAPNGMQQNGNQSRR
jgi:hypothetical protein